MKDEEGKVEREEEGCGGGGYKGRIHTEEKKEGRIYTRKKGGYTRKEGRIYTEGSKEERIYKEGRKDIQGRKEGRIYKDGRKKKEGRKER